MKAFLGSSKQQQSNNQQRRHTPRPIVLDATTPDRTRRRATPSLPPVFLEHPLHPWTDNANKPPRNEQTAAALARNAPHAGFLHKMGRQVPVDKRRFFVLQPGTCLYYFNSPHDTEPRGCLDVDDCNIEDISADRFRITWSGSQEQQPVELQARSPEMAQEWKKALRTQTFRHVQSQHQRVLRQHDAQACRIKELEQQLREFKLIESDRDGAMDDARKWKEAFETLDEALRRLSMQLRKNSEDSSNSNIDEQTDEKKDGSDEDNNDSANVNNTSLLDQVIADMENIDITQIPGRHFSTLHNACQQLRENYTLASREATTNIEDLKTAQKHVETLEKRMAKAESHLCKLWEENCAVRKSLKLKKREKRVLVREIKTLMEAAKSGSENKATNDDYSADDDSDGEKLIDELEGHLLSSIRLHEQLVGRPSDTALATGNKTNTQHVATLPSKGMRSSMNIAPAVTAQQSEKRPATVVASLMDTDSDNVESDDDDDNDSVGADAMALSDISSIQVEASDDEKELPSDVGKVLAHPQIVKSKSSPERLHPIGQLDSPGPDENDGEIAKPPRLAFQSTTRATSKLVCPLADVVTSNENNKPDIAQDDIDVYHLTFYSRKIGLQFQKVPPPPTKPRGILTDALTADLTSTKSVGKTSNELRRISAIAGVSNSSKETDSDITKYQCPVAVPKDAVLVCGFEGFDDTGCNKRPKLGARLIAFDGISVEVGQWTFDSIRKSIQARARPLTLSFRNDFLTTEQRAVLTKAVNQAQAAVRRFDKYAIPPPSSNTSVTSDTTSNKNHGNEMRAPSIAANPSTMSMGSHESDVFVNRDYDKHGTFNHRTSSVGNNALAPSSVSQQALFTPPPSYNNGNTAAIQEYDDLSMTSSAANSAVYTTPSYYNPRRHQQSGTRSLASSHSRGSNNYHSNQYSFRSFSEAGSTVSVLSAVGPLVANLLGNKNKDKLSTPDYMTRQRSVESTPQFQDFRSELL